MKINWEITLLSLIALFLGIVVYTIWSVYNFAPTQMAIATALEELEKAASEQQRLGGQQWEEHTRRAYEPEWKHTRGTSGGGASYEDPVTLEEETGIN